MGNWVHESFSFVIQNRSNAIKHVNLFGGQESGITNDFCGKRDTDEISCHVPESSHAQVRAESISAPYFANGFMLITDNIINLYEVIRLSNSVKEGCCISRPICPFKYKIKKFGSRYKVHIKDKFEVTGITSISFNVLPQSIICLIVHKGDRLWDKEIKEFAGQNFVAQEQSGNILFSSK